ncbi:MAG: hypothetical protein ACRD0P_04630 [Stackebrandtia sp.]
MRSSRRKLVIGATVAALVTTATVTTTYLAHADDVETKEQTTQAVWTDETGIAAGKGYFYGDGEWVNAKDYENDGSSTKVDVHILYRGEWRKHGKTCHTSSGKNCDYDIVEGTQVRLWVRSGDGYGKGHYSKAARA